MVDLRGVENFWDVGTTVFTLMEILSTSSSTSTSSQLVGLGMATTRVLPSVLTWELNCLAWDIAIALKVEHYQKKTWKAMFSEEPVRERPAAPGRFSEVNPILESSQHVSVTSGLANLHDLLILQAF
ncbi:hypothetical protein GJ744_009162 [Endocarpon pusillum]|uniref:Uncharacterized protein n=1 Tax=Endocarpon pusillum TaxID=364733 RepID=A0A8H7AGK7_9EURO|nr:hypothetical protein GJ744_009162 [Endocarpon pusillum]